MGVTNQYLKFFRSWLYLMTIWSSVKIPGILCVENSSWPENLKPEPLRPHPSPPSPVSTDFVTREILNCKCSSLLFDHGRPVSVGCPDRRNLMYKNFTMVINLWPLILCFCLRTKRTLLSLLDRVDLTLRVYRRRVITDEGYVPSTTWVDSSG